MRKRKRNGARRQRRAGRSGAQALATATALAGGTQAYADAIRFENNGQFEWSECGQTIGLDVTLPAGAQDGQLGPSSFQQLRGCLHCDYYDAITLFAPSAGSLAIKLCVQYEGIYPYVARLASGTWIEREMRRPVWRSSGQVYCTYYCAGWPPPATSFIGIRFLAGDGYHYGWVLGQTSNQEQLHLAALAWGYETEPNTPIRAGDGVAPCTQNETLRLTCKAERAEIKVVLKKATPGLPLRLRLDDDPDTDQRIIANERGKAKAKFTNVSPGQHTVKVLECGLAKDVACEP